ncbi:hypothetical protein GCM10023195_30470 [Actinoallomurus liliacearum]|uniref:Uncharacterized protein n=1 Tax=Actinoallomurus liliacearum TaxID=1080073 RepID=A0ABP8TIS8_9ACTN
MERHLSSDLDGIGLFMVLGRNIDVIVHAEEGRTKLDAHIEATGDVFETEAAKAELVPVVDELELALFPVVTRSRGLSGGVHVGGNLIVQADRSSIAAPVINGPVRLGGGRVTIGDPTPAPATDKGHLTVTFRIPSDFKIRVSLESGDITTHGVPEDNARLRTNAGTVTPH